MAEPYTFKGEIKGLGIGKALGQDTASAVTGHVTFEFNALEVSLNRLVRLKKMGQLQIQIVQVQAELPRPVTDGTDDMFPVEPPVVD